MLEKLWKRNRLPTPPVNIDNDLFNRFRDLAIIKNEYSSNELDRLFYYSPALWPIHLSQKSTAVAFSDNLGRIAVIEGNNGPKPMF